MHVAASTILTVFLLILCIVSARTQPTSRHHRRHHKHDKITEKQGHRGESAARKRQQILQSLKGEEECCPTVKLTVQPIIGRSKTGMGLELYRGVNGTQQFTEVSCMKRYLNRKCRFVEPGLAQYSRCKQQYSHTYALVREFNSTAPFRMDFITIRSGCSCYLIPPPANTTVSPPPP